MTFAEILKNIREILCSSLETRISEYLIFKIRKKSYLKTKKTPSTQHFKYDNTKKRHVVILQNATCSKYAPHPTNHEAKQTTKTIGITTAHHRWLSPLLSKRNAGAKTMAEDDIIRLRQKKRREVHDIYNTVLFDKGQ